MTVKGRGRAAPAPVASLNQMENIGADLRWIGVPAFLPVTVNLPRNFGTSVSMLRTPLANRRMGVGESRVRAKVDCRDDAACGQPGAMNPAIAFERFRNLRAHFDGPLVVQIQRHVSTRAGE